MQDQDKRVLEEQFAKLPKVVQAAITSGHVTEKFRVLAEKHRLHLDQWQQIENLLMLTVLGLSSPEDLPEKIVSITNWDVVEAHGLVEDVIATVFRPIREELERELGAPQAREEEMSDIDKLRQEVLADKPAAAPVVTPGTPPAPAPTEKIARTPASGAYQPGETSAVRDDVHDDPYREPVK